MQKLARLLLLLILFASCKVIKPEGPNLPPSQINTTPLPESKIEVPITIDLTTVFNDFDASIDRDFGEERNVNSSLKYNWGVHRQPMNLSLTSNGSLNIADAANCGGEVKGKNPINGQWFHICGCNAVANIGLNAKFNLNSDYSLIGNVTKTSFTLSDCNLCQININVSPIALSIVNPKIDQSLITLNQKIGTYNFKNKFEPAWESIFNTINISDIGFLSINPTAISLGLPTGSGHILHFDAGITANPIISLTNPPPTPVLPIPNLSATSGSGFNVYVDGHLQYPALNKILQTNLIGKKIKYATKGYVQIKNIEISGTGSDHLIVKINFKAKYHWITYKGDLYFTCVPKYDATNKILFVSDIDFDPKTQQKLKDKGAAWILNTALKTFLGSEVKVSIASQIDDIKNKLTAGLNRQIGANATLSGNITDLNFAGILPVKDYILVRIKTAGNAAVTIN